MKLKSDISKVYVKFTSYDWKSRYLKKEQTELIYYILHFNSMYLIIIFDLKK